MLQGNVDRWMVGRGLLFVLFFLGFSGMAAAEGEPHVPKANLEVNNAVPLPLLKQIAWHKCRETWGKGSLGEPVPLSDADGNVVVYMFPYQIGGEKFPPYDEILRGVKEGRELHRLIGAADVKQAKDLYRRMDRRKVEAAEAALIAGSKSPQLPVMATALSDGSMSNRQELEGMIRFAAQKASGAGEFGTIFVAATYDQPPIPAYFHYLTPYVTKFDLALENAELEIGRGAVLKRIIFQGLQGQYLEFENGGSRVLLNSKSLEKQALEAFSPSASRPVQDLAVCSPPSPRKVKRDAEISREWKKLEAESGGAR